MIYASLFDMGEVMEIMTHCFGENTEHILGMHKALSQVDSHVFLSDSGDSIVWYAPMYDNRYHMHHASKVGGRDMVKLLRKSVKDMFENRKAEVLLGFVPERKDRLLIGMSSRLTPVAEVAGDHLYIITKENYREVDR